MNEPETGLDCDNQGAPAPRMSLRQRMLSPALEQQQQSDPECSPGTTRRATTNTAASASSSPSAPSSTASSDAAATSLEASPEGANTEEEQLSARLEKMLASGRGWAERSSRSLQAIDAELRSIDGAVAGLASEIKEAARLEADVKKLRKSGAVSAAAARDLLQRVGAARREMTDAKRKAEPRTAGFLAEFLMGRFNVKMYRDGERYVLKSKYEQFKQLSALPFLLFIGLSFLFPQSHLVKSLFNVCSFPFPFLFIPLICSLVCVHWIGFKNSHGVSCITFRCRAGSRCCGRTGRGSSSGGLCTTTSRRWGALWCCSGRWRARRTSRRSAC